MMKNIFGLIAVSALLATPAFAKTFKLPNDEFAIAAISFPSDWDPSEVDNGVEGQSPDGAVYMSAVAVGSDKGMEAEIDDTFAFLAKHKVDFDKASQKESEFELNGEKVKELIFAAKDKDGPCTVSISFIPIKNKVVVLTYWVTTESEEEHKAEVGKILTSIKPSS